MNFQSPHLNLWANIQYWVYPIFFLQASPQFQIMSCHIFINESSHLIPQSRQWANTYPTNEPKHFLSMSHHISPNQWVTFISNKWATTTPTKWTANQWVTTSLVNEPLCHQTNDSHISKMCPLANLHPSNVIFCIFTFLLTVCTMWGCVEM